MGAVEFYHEAIASSASSAFKTIVNDARERYGDNPYNGTISTCRMGSIHRIGSGVYEKNLDAEARSYVAKKDGGRKWEAGVLDLGVVYYDVVEAKKEGANPLTAKYLTKHAVIDGTGKVICYKDTKKEADDEAKRLVLESYAKDKLEDYIVKKIPVNVNNGNDVESTFYPKAHRVMGTEGKPKNTKGKVVVEAHKYVFYGLASE